MQIADDYQQSDERGISVSVVIEFRGGRECQQHRQQSGFERYPPVCDARDVVPPPGMHVMHPLVGYQKR
jgi:hypothetical protein